MGVHRAPQLLQVVAVGSLERMLMAAAGTRELRGTGELQAVLLPLTCPGSLQLCNRGSTRAASAPCQVQPRWSAEDWFC